MDLFADRPYRKLKCVFCGYELASRAKEPKCSTCGSRRFNQIEQFSVVKPYLTRKINEEKQPMADTKKQAKEAAKEEQSKDAVVESNDDDDDDLDKALWG